MLGWSEECVINLALESQGCLSIAGAYHHYWEDRKVSYHDCCYDPWEGQVHGSDHSTEQLTRAALYILPLFLSHKVLSLP